MKVQVNVVPESKVKKWMRQLADISINHFHILLQSKLGSYPLSYSQFLKMLSPDYNVNMDETVYNAVLETFSELEQKCAEALKKVPPIKDNADINYRMCIQVLPDIAVQQEYASCGITPIHQISSDVDRWANGL